MKVLIVDDNPTRRNEIKNLISDSLGLSDNEIYMAHNTQKAKDLMRTISFEFLVLDVVLPKNSLVPNMGSNYLKKLKHDQRLENLEK